MPSLGYGIKTRSRRPRVSSGGSPGAYDYIIASQGDWATIPAGLKTGGGLIGVAPGAYTSITLDAINPSAPLIFEGYNRPIGRNAATWELEPLAVAKSRINKTITQNTSNLVFRNLEIVSDDWFDGNQAAFSREGTTGNQSFEWCHFHAGYRGNMNVPLDANATYPEYACIKPTVTAGVITALEIIRPFVGDLMADGTYPIYNIPGRGTGFTGTMTVSAGNIVSAVITTGGTGTPTSGLTRIITWAGQQRLIDFIPYAVQNLTGGLADVNAGDLICNDCLFSDIGNAFKLGQLSSAGKVQINRSMTDRVYQDDISLGTSPNIAGPILEINWFIANRPIAREGDAGDPHKDGIQIFRPSSEATVTPFSWKGIRVRGFIAVDNGGRGSFQGLFGGVTGSPLSGWGVDAAGMLIASSNASNALSLACLDDAYIALNTVARYDPTDPRNISPSLMRFDDGLGTSLIASNITEGLTILSGAITTANASQHPNTVIGLNGAKIPYSTVFNQTGGALPLNPKQAWEYFTAKGAYANQGATKPGYLDWANFAINLNLEPTFAKLDIKVDQPVNSSVVSNRAVIMGGPLTGNIVMTNGQFTLSDDAAGTNETSPATSGNYTRGKYLKLIVTTSVNGSTASRATATMNGWAVNFDAITSTVVQFPIADNQGTAYSKMNPPAIVESGLSKLLVGMRVRTDVFTTNQNYMAQASASTFRIYGVGTTTKSLRLQVGSSSQVNAVANVDLGTDWVKLLFSVDFTQTDVNDGVKMVKDFTRLGYSSATFDPIGGTRTFSTTNIFGSGTTGIGVFGEADGGGVLFNGAWRWVWMSWGNAAWAMPDINDPFVQAAFSADRFGADGSTDLFGAPKRFYQGDLTAWNSGGGIVNLGTEASAPLVKQAGNYV